MEYNALDFDTPNVGYEDSEGRAICGCCRTYYIVSPGDLAEIKETVSDLYEACKEMVGELKIHTTKWDLGMLEMIDRANKAIAKVEGG